MWQIENGTPFPAERTWARDRNGEEIWIVAVKCTFTINPDGTTEIAANQSPVLRFPEYYGEPGKSSMRYESDLILTKTTTDVIVVGHAYAPGGRPVTHLDVGFRVGPLEKRLKVIGDRIWEAQAPSSPVPFTKMPLMYERAFGGANSEQPDRDWDGRNPVGTGFARSRDSVTGVRLPNVEYPGEMISLWNDRPRPAGFGAIGPNWQPRAGLAGTYDEHWRNERQPLVPVDFDDRFYQCAPPDQQSPGFLRGGESVLLYRLTSTGELRFVLPRVFLGFQTRFSDGSRVFHQSRRLHSVIVEPDYPRVSLVWHTALPCHFMMHKLDRTIVTLKQQMGASTSGDEDS